MYAINTLLKDNSIILLQEHWLFQCQIDYLGELGNNICFIGKGVDKNNPIEPTQMPRGYGGVAVLWKDKLDSVIRPLEDGSERIQCIELSFFFQQKLLVISAYLPTRSNRESDLEFHVCVDQLNEICQKFNHTYDIVIGGDLNEDLSKCDSKNNRITYLREFLNENNMKYSCTGKTFVKSNGVECSEIDYFLHRINGVKVTVDKRIINTDCNVPIIIQFRSNSKEIVIFNPTQKLPHL